MNRSIQEKPKSNPFRSGTRISRIEPLEKRTMMAAGYDLGVNVNSGSAGIVDEGSAVMKQLGAKTVRVWIGVGDFNKRSMSGGLQRAIDYSKAGFDVLAIVNTNGGKVPSPAAVSRWFDWAAGNSTIRKAVDRWEIGNEIDHAAYWRGSVRQYVTGFLKPAAEALHDHGEPVVSAGPSWNPEDVREMINEGMLNYVDYVGFHPYANSVSLMKQRIGELKSIVNGRKPLVASEWNVRGLEKDKTQWAAAVKEALPVIRDNFALNYYFGLINTNSTMAGPGGIMYAGGKKTPFYDALSAGRSTKPDSTPQVGNTASAAPKIRKISVYNADTDKVFIDSLKNGDVIDLAKTKTRNLTFVVTVESGTSSIRFTVNESVKSTDNSKPYIAFGGSGSNFKGKIFNVGTHKISATPYEKNNAKGVAGAMQKFQFTVKESKPASNAPARNVAPSITAIRVVDAITGKTIKGYENVTSRKTIKLSDLPTRNLAVIALGNDGTRSMRMRINDRKSTVEYLHPFAFFGDSDSGYNTWIARRGNYTFNATAFAGSNADGKQGNTLSVRLRFV